MITYTWDFGELDVAPLENGLKDVVKEINWTLFAEEEVGSDALVVMEQGTAILPAPEAGSFVKFESILKDWLEAALAHATPPVNVVALKESLAAKIAAAKVPARVKKLPAYKAQKEG